MPTPLAGTITIHPNNEQVTAPPIEYTDAEKIYINFRRQRMINARDMRDMARPEWDDMPFLTYFDILKKADDQYVAPRKNAQDTSINLGTIRDKDTSLVEYAMAHDFEPIAQAFDEDEDMFEELAETGEDLVRKSLKIEDWREKSKLIYRSMVSFGTALVEDAYVQRWVMEKTMKKGFKAGMGSDKAEWETKMKMQYDGCQAKLLDLRKCYFGDIRKFFMNGPQGQPYFFTVEYESYDVVKQRFGAMDRFKHVSTFANPTPELSSTSFAFNWSLRPVSMNFVEVIWYYDPVANELQLTLNGTDMLPLMKTTIKDTDGSEKVLISGFPLTELSPSGLIPFAKYDLEPMHDFAYSKGLPAKMRVTADVENMLMKLFIIMFKQKAKPTMGNKSGRLFGPEVTDPATVINDIRDGDLFPVLPSFTGAVPADFTFYENVKKELDKNSVERSWQGMDATQSDETATKNLNDQKAQVTLKVAAMFDGIISGNKQLYWLRTYNIMKNWTKPTDFRIDAAQKQLKQIYRTITIEADGRGGEKVAKKIVFTKDTPKLAEGKKRASLDDSFKVYQDELDHQDEYGTDLRITYLHPELFAALKAKWFYDCVPVPTSTDPLSYMVFAKQITDAMTFFGPQSMNVKKLKHRFSALTGNDFDTWFLNEKEMAMQQAMNPQPDPNDPNATQKPGVPGKPTGAGPSIATAMSGAKPAEMIGALAR